MHQTDHFLNSVICENIRYGFDFVTAYVMMLNSLQLMVFCLKKSIVRKEIF